MSLEICVLGSGSGGNSTVVRSRRKVLLVDAGFGPRATAQRLAGTGVDVSQIGTICLTHLDRDHFNYNWLATLVKYRIRVYCHEECVEHLKRAINDFAAGREKMMGAGELVAGYRTEEPFEAVEGMVFHPIRCAHDQEGSHGFLIESEGCRLGYATDLGCIPEGLIERFCGVHVLAMESNYDPEMEKNSDRPWYLKQRIMGGSGHLSNEQAFAAVRAILDATQAQNIHLPRHIVLLHRSRQCNCPKLVRRLFESDARIKRVLTLAEQYERTEWLRVRQEQPLSGEQLALAWG